MTTRAKASRLPALILAWLACAPVAVTAAEITERSPEAVVGRDVALGAEFSARATGDVVTVEIGLRGGKRLLARIDHAVGSVSVRSVAAGRDGAEAPAPLDQADVRTFQALHRTVGPLPHRVGDALGSVLALLAEAPPGIVLDVDTTASGAAATEKGEQAAAAPGGIRSLCNTARSTGSYTLGSQRVSTRVAVGPCYSEANECLGRCGRGCRTTTVAGVSNPDTVQRFTQDCLNHDLCVRRTGDNLGDCADEFRAVVDDFLTAPDCGSLTGRWTDNLGEAWSLEQRDDLSVRGTVTLPRCGRLAVSGRHRGASVALTATGRPTSAGCPAKVTYAGRLNSCVAASGTVTTGGDGSGQWRLSRGGGR